MEQEEFKIRENELPPNEFGAPASGRQQTGRPEVGAPNASKSPEKRENELSLGGRIGGREGYKKCRCAGKNKIICAALRRLGLRVLGRVDFSGVAAKKRSRRDISVEGPVFFCDPDGFGPCFYFLLFL